MLSLRSVWQRNFHPSLTVLWELLRDGLQFLNVVARSRTAVAAEVVFLRKQLAYHQDHQIRPRRLTDAARLSLVLWSQLFEWKEALIVVTVQFSDPLPCRMILPHLDRKSTRLNSSHLVISYAVFCLKKK